MSDNWCEGMLLQDFLANYYVQPAVTCGEYSPRITPAGSDGLIPKHEGYSHRALPFIPGCPFPKISGNRLQAAYTRHSQSSYQGNSDRRLISVTV